MIDFSLDLKEILTALAILTAIIIALYFQWWRNRKKLSYDIVTKTSLLFASAEIKNELQILFKGKSVEHLYLLVIRIINDGYLPIKKDDFEEHLSFAFPENSEFISFEVVRTNPKNLNIQASLSENKLLIEPLLLNSKDFLEIKLLLSSDKVSFKPDARIVGIKAIEARHGYRRSSLLNLLKFITLPALVGLLSIFVLIFPSVIGQISHILTILMFVLIFLASILLSALIKETFSYEANDDNES